MKLNKFAYLYSKPLGNHTLKIMKKIPGNLLKKLEKSWKYHGILSVRKSGNPGFRATSEQVGVANHLLTIIRVKIQLSYFDKFDVNQLILTAVMELQHRAGSCTKVELRCF